MEWIVKLADEEKGEPESMEVEIGYQPKMEILMVWKVMSHFNKQQQLPNTVAYPEF